MSPFLPFLFLLLLNILAEDLPDVQFCEEIESRQGVYFIECQNSAAYLPDPDWCTVFHQCAFGRSFAKCCGTCQHPAGMSLPTCCSKSEAEGGCQNLRLHWDPIAYTCVRPEDVYPKRNCSIPRQLLLRLALQLKYIQLQSQLRVQLQLRLRLRLQLRF